MYANTLSSSEIFPTHIRSQGTGFSMMGLYLADIIILVAGPIALDKIQWKFFFVLICPTVLHLFFVYFMCPETKGRSLEDINALFGEKVAIHYYGATDKEKEEFEAAIHVDEEVDQTHNIDRSEITKVVAQQVEHRVSDEHTEKV